MERGSILLTAALAGAVSGVIGSFATGWIRDKPAEKKPAKAAVVKPAEEGNEMEARLAALEAEVARLRQHRPPMMTQPPAGVRPADSAKERPAPDDPVFEAAVRDVMDRVQQERAGEREERRGQAVQQWADSMGEKLSLSEQQKASVLAIGQEFLQSAREQREQAGGPPSPGPRFGEARMAVLAQSEQRIRDLLTPKQMEVYQASSELHLINTLRGGTRWRGGGRDP